MLSTIANWRICIRYLWTKRHASLVPIIGGASGFASLLIVPLPFAKALSWLPLVVDIGTGPELIYLLVFLIRRKHSSGMGLN